MKSSFIDCWVLISSFICYLENMEKVVASFYKFIELSDLSFLKKKIFDLNLEKEIKGSIIIADEGINGSLYGSKKNIHKIIDEIATIKEFNDLNVDYNFTIVETFKNFKVKIKNEIVTIGDKSVKPINHVGVYIEPNNWDNFIKRDDVIVIDTRNKYEVKIGTFENSVNPQLNNFREFPEWWKKNHKRFEKKKIAMFCTGGIRCEKSTSLLKETGFEDVYHLRGGIINYLKQPSKSKNSWIGECFVFDQRVSVIEGINQGKYKLCFGCRRPISEKDIKHKYYEEGVSCPECINEHSSKRKEGFRERQKQKVLYNKKYRNI